MKLSDTDVEKLREHPLWHELTDRQQRFLVNFVQSDGQKEQSVEAVYDCRDNRSARAMVSTLLRRPTIKQILLEVCGYELKRTHITRGELLSLISVRLRNNKLSIREFTLLSGVYSDLKGWRKRGPGRQPRQIVVNEDSGEKLSPKDDLMRLVQQYERENRDVEEDEEN